MQSFIQPGDVVTLNAPYIVASGAGCLKGALFGVATSPVANGADGEFSTVGVHSLAKVTTEVWTQGALIYWDNTAKLCTSVSTSNTRIGCAMLPTVNPSAAGFVRLNSQAAPTGA